MRDFAFENVKDPKQESDKHWSQPFPYEVPDFPERQKRRYEEPVVVHSARHKAPHAPSFLPPYPPIHTFKKTIPGTKKRSHRIEKDDETQRAKRQNVVKSVENSLVKIESSIGTAPPQLRHSGGYWGDIGRK